MCFVRHYIIVSPFGLWYFTRKKDLKEAVRKLQTEKQPFAVYKWTNKHPHFKKIGGNVYET